MPLIERIASKVLQRYWRWTRAMTLGAQGMVLNDRDEVLLIRHTYRTGWFFPGGGVERGENIVLSLKRELEEEAGVLLDGVPEMAGIYTNFSAFPGDHIALFKVRAYTQPVVPKPNAEIAEQGFFPLTNLPDGINPGTRRRIDEHLGRMPQSTEW